MMKDSHCLERQNKHMDGKLLELYCQQLLTYAAETMNVFRVYPYAAFVIKNNTIVAKGRNQEQETRDVTRQSEVVAIREAQRILSTGSLDSCTLLSLMEPTILSFDVAMWAGIRDFAWCVDATYFSEHYTLMNYSPLTYKSVYPEKITVTHGICTDEAIRLIEEAKKQKFYPDTLLIR